MMNRRPLPRQRAGETKGNSKPSCLKSPRANPKHEIALWAPTAIIDRPALGKRHLVGILPRMLPISSPWLGSRESGGALRCKALERVRAGRALSDCRVVPAMVCEGDRLRHKLAVAPRGIDGHVVRQIEDRQLRQRWILCRSAHREISVKRVYPSRLCVTACISQDCHSDGFNGACEIWCVGTDPGKDGRDCAGRQGKVETLDDRCVSPGPQIQGLTSKKNCFTILIILSCMRSVVQTFS